MVMYPFDPTFWLLLPALLIAIWASYKVNTEFNTYARVYNRKGISAREVARKILDEYGLYDVEIERVEGHLTDHYDPSKRVLRLSDSVYDSTSISAIGVSAHEVGHAIQHAYGYTPLMLRNAIVPIVNIGSNLAFPLFLLGILFSSLRWLMDVGIILFAGVVLFHLITLPVEFDASNRALRILEERGILVGEELVGARKVLRAAGMTYLASTLMALMNLLRLLLIRNMYEE